MAMRKALLRHSPLWRQAAPNAAVRPAAVSGAFRWKGTAAAKADVSTQEPKEQMKEAPNEHGKTTSVRPSSDDVRSAKKGGPLPVTFEVREAAERQPTHVGRSATIRMLNIIHDLASSLSCW